MTIRELPTEISTLLGAENTEAGLLDRIDQTWSAALSGRPEDAERYVRAVATLNEVVLERATLRFHPRGVLPDMAHLVSVAALAPIVTVLPAWQAVLERTIEMVGRIGEMSELTSAAKQLELVNRSVVSENYSPTTVMGFEALGAGSAIMAVLAGRYEAPISRIRRVLNPRSVEELATWLGASRPAVLDWESGATRPTADRWERVTIVDEIARILDEYIDPEDIESYFRQTELPAFDGKVLADVISQSGDSAKSELNRAYELLRFGLVQ